MYNSTIMKKTVFVAIFKNDVNSGGFRVKKDTKLFVHTESTIQYEFENHGNSAMKNQVFVMRSDGAGMGINIFGVDRNAVEVRQETIECPFKLGDIVCRNEGKKEDQFPFRITSIRWDRIDFWCQDGWGDGQNYASGRMAKTLRLATDEEVKKHENSIVYYDEIFIKGMNKIIGK
jgi:hypothetical protein